MNTPPPVPLQPPLCRTCSQGALMPRKTFRMSGPVVGIGFILLIPSVLGMLFGILMLVGASVAGAASSHAGTLDQQTRSGLEAQHVPEPIITQLAAGKRIDDAQLVGLTPQQQIAVHGAELSVSASKLGSGAAMFLAGGFSIFIVAMSFVGGLVGWLLVMRKRILQCVRCGAVVSAS